MKEHSKHKGFKSFLAGLLVLVLAISPILSSLPAIQVSAADQEIWYRVFSGAGNGNGHEYSKASTQPAAVLLHKEAKMEIGQSLSASYQMLSPSTSRFGVFYTYIDDSNWVYVGANPNGSWYYEYKVDGQGSYADMSLPSNNSEDLKKITITLKDNKLTAVLGDATADVIKEEFVKLAEKEKGRVGFRAGRFQDQNTSFRFSDVKIGTTALAAKADSWSFLCPGLEGQKLELETPIAVYNVTGKVLDKDKKPLKGAVVRIDSKSTTAGDDGAFTLTGISAGKHQLTASAAGYVAASVGIEVTDKDLQLADALLLSKRGEAVYEQYIESAELKVAVSKTFPQVMQYETKTGSKKIMYAQDAQLSQMKINGVEIKPEIEGSVTFTENTATYPLILKNADSKIDLKMTVKISVDKYNTTWEVTELKKQKGCAKIHTIEVPNLNLATIYSEGKNEQFKGAVLSGNTSQSGDREITFEGGFVAGNSDGYAYAFVSNSDLSAGLWSNSEATDDKRVVRNNGIDSISITSAAWYYEYGDIAAAAQYEGTPVSDLPCAKVCIADDKNGDNTVNWQDGAIAYRDIMNNPLGSERVPELVNTRIVMNFSSQATNPFLKTADNIKRVYLATDGLGQAVMMKGYGSEGHDSANSEYGYVGERIGGIEDLKKLNEIAHKYNTETGIHVNAQEAYPEAQTFSKDLINGTSATGWGWLDQSYTINRNYDLGSGLRYKRILQLYDRLNGTNLYANKWPNIAGTGKEEEEKIADEAKIAETVKNNKGKTNLDFIYLDVWYGDAWETRKVAKQFNSLGWRWTTEFGTTGEYDSTWQHWATEGPYGGATKKGINSDVIRFIRNHQKDSFILNWPSYKETADQPLLGGYDLGGFEGWQNNNNFDEYITKTFAINLPTKFLQHYQVTKWVNYGDTDPKEKSPVGNHEKEITLKKGDDTVVVTRKSEKKRTDGYVERTIKLNDKVVLDDVSYLLPWTDDKETGKTKLYHYNHDGGETEWELPKGWEAVKSVYVYKLTDQGRTDKATVAVTSGKVKLKAEAKTPYVVVQGESVKTIDNYGEGTYLKDPGFNNYAGTGEGAPLDGKIWKGDVADAKVVRVESGTKYLALGKKDKAVSVSTEITGLKAGENYVAQVYVDNKSDAKAFIEVTGGEKTVSNYTLKSLAGNYVRCDAHNVNAVQGSKMQTMLVSFKAKGTTATLTLKREAGDALTYFDDLRVIPKTLNNFQEDGSFKQDFESVAGGLYPFVMGPAQGVDDQVTHLSERHDPYTQSGWGNVVLDDVIDGKWSLKHHGSDNGMIYRTIPQNLHLEPNVTYNISFDYQAGCDDAYRIVIGDGEEVVENLEYMKKTAASEAGQKSSTKRFTFQLTGAESGQSWFGLDSTGATGADQPYGQQDFVLDNLEVKLSEMTINKGSLEMKGIGSVEKLTVGFLDKAERKITWSSSAPEIVAVDENGFVDAIALGNAEITASAEVDGKAMSVKCRVTVIDQKLNVPKGQFEKVLYFNTEEKEGEQAEASNIIDGNPGTIWHSEWQNQKFNVTEDNPAIVILQLKADAKAFSGLQVVQRPNGSNGVVSKLSYTFGNSYDAEKHTVGDVVVEKTVTVNNASMGSVENIALGKEVTAKYLQIKVLDGAGNFAAIAEVNTFTSETYPGLKDETTNATAAASKLEAAKTASDEANKAVEEAKKTLASATTDVDKAAAEWKIAEAERVAAEAAAELAKAEKEAADAEKALEEAKAERYKDNAEIKAREEAKAQAAAKRSNEAVKNIPNLEKAVETAKINEQVKKEAFDRIIKQPGGTNPGPGPNPNPGPNPGPEQEPVTADVKGVTYKVLDKAKGTAVALKVKSKTVKSVNIPASVKIGKKSYKVTQIANNAFKGCKKLTKAIIGKNVTSIGKNSFMSCSKLAKVTFKGTLVKTVKAGAFKKTSSKMTVSTPKKLKAKKRNSLKKALIKSGMNKKAKIK